MNPDHLEVVTSRHFDATQISIQQQDFDTYFPENELLRGNNAEKQIQVLGLILIELRKQSCTLVSMNDNLNSIENATPSESRFR